MTGGERGAQRRDASDWRLIVRNDLAEVGAANGALEEFLGARGLDPQVVISSALILEELVTNIIKYGYDDDAPHEILVEARILPDEIELCVIDDGHEFDPLDGPPPVLEGPIEDRPIGGLGLHLVKSLARRASYERAGGRNIVIVCLSLQSH